MNQPNRPQKKTEAETILDELRRYQAEGQSAADDPELMQRLKNFLFEPDAEPKPERRWLPADHFPTTQWLYGKADRAGMAKDVEAIVEQQEGGRWRWYLSRNPEQGVELDADDAMRAAVASLEKTKRNAILVGGPLDGHILGANLRMDGLCLPLPGEAEVTKAKALFYGNTYQDTSDGLRVFRFAGQRVTK
jgi:hypothetical protein